jgi:c-di-GMP-binding flagellar brake protein YcgR
MFFKRKTKVPPVSEPAPPAIAPLDTDVDATPFLVQDERDIAEMLEVLAADADLLTLYPSDGGAHLSGRIVEVIPQARRFVVEAVGQRMPGLGPMLVVTQPRGIKQQFHTEGIWQSEPGQPLRWTAALPDGIVNVQRRRFPRLEQPVGSPMRVEFTSQGKAYVLTVDDLSLGGVGLRASASDGGGIMPGQTLRKVRLELGQDHPLAVGLEICSRRAFRSFLAGEQLHFGCRFIDLEPADLAEIHEIVRRFDAARDVRSQRSDRPAT